MAVGHQYVSKQMLRGQAYSNSCASYPNFEELPSKARCQHSLLACVTQAKGGQRVLLQDVLGKMSLRHIHLTPLLQILLNLDLLRLLHPNWTSHKGFLGERFRKL